MVNSRPRSRPLSVWRRRQCLGCKSIYTTDEKPDLYASLKIKDSSGKFRSFSEDKLLISIYECLSHKEEPLKASRSLVNTLLGEVLPFGNNSLKTSTIAEETYKILRRYDKAAALIYKARHPIF